MNARTTRPHRTFAGAVAITAAASFAACDASDRVTRAIPLTHGGAALVGVEIGAGSTALVTFEVDDAAAGETYTLLATEGERPDHTGWLDLAPHDDQMDACAAGARGPLCDDIGGRGRFVDRAAHEGGRPLRLTATLSCTGWNTISPRDECPTTWFTVLSRTPLGETRAAIVSVTTEHDLNATEATILYDPPPGTAR